MPYIERERGVKIHYDGTDMSDPVKISRMMRSITREFTPIDILVNNVGIQYVAPIDEFPAEKWDQIFAINLSSEFHTIRMLCQVCGSGNGAGSSTSHQRTGLVASPYKSAYVASNTALRA